MKAIISRPLEKLRERERLGHRSPGYVALCLRVGRHDASTGLVHFTPAAFRYVRQHQLIKRGLAKRGPGDWLKMMLHPYVRFSDRFFGTRWETCTRCQWRAHWINRKFHGLKLRLQYWFTRLVTHLKKI